MKPMKPAEFAICRERLEWTQDATAQFFHVTQRTVLRWENDQSPIPVAVALVLRVIMHGLAGAEDLAKLATVRS